MHFQYCTQHYDESPEGYRVSHARIGPRARHTAWAPTTTVNQWTGKEIQAWELLGSFDTAEEARGACEGHAKEKAA